MAETAAGAAGTPESETIAAGFLRGLRLGAFGVLIVVLLCWHLPTLIAFAGSYQPLWLEAGGMGALIAVAAVAGAVVLRDRAWGRLRWPLLAAALLGTAVATAAVPPRYLIGDPHWSWEIFGWFAVLLLLDQPVSWLIAAIAANLMVTGAQVGLAHRGDVRTLAGMAIVTLVVAGWQVVVVLAAAALRRAAAAASASAAHAEQLRTAESTAERLRQDRAARYAELAVTTEPLLTGLSTGDLDPADPQVRQDCAIEAARLRRLFAERDDAADPLQHELRACIEVAERRGVEVQFAARGELPALPLEVRRALTDPALRALALSAATARVTLDTAGQRVVLSVVADTAGTGPAYQDTAVQVAGGRVDISWLTGGQTVWMEGTWSPSSQPG